MAGQIDPEIAYPGNDSGETKALEGLSRRAENSHYAAIPRDFRNAFEGWGVRYL